MSNPEEREIAALETVHHACAAGDFDAAAAILYNRVYHGPDAVISRVQGRNEVALAALLDFFPFHDLSLEPRVSVAAARRWLLHETAAVLHQVGRLREAETVGVRAFEAALNLGEQHSACLTLHNLAETYLAVGALSRCESAAQHALSISVDCGEHEDELVACTLLGTVADLQGQMSVAASMFERALLIARDYTEFPILFSLSGVRYANHLAHSNDLTAARAAAEVNERFCERQSWISDLALTRGQLARWSDGGLVPQLELADDALGLARAAGHHDVLAACLLERARILRRERSLKEARADVDEAIALVRSAGYRLLEAEARVVSAHVRLDVAADDHANAEIAMVGAYVADLGLEVLRPDLDELRRRQSSPQS